MTAILVIDHRPRDLDEVSDILAGHGYEVTTATTAEAGLELCDQQKFALILLEMEVPKQGGPQMLETLHHRGNKAPVIYTTSKLDAAAVREGMAFGLANFIIKPIDRDELGKKLEKLLGEAPALESHVLLVDDSSKAEAALRKTLPENIPAKAATSPEQAKLLCDQHRFAFIIIDTVIPDVDSVALRNELQEMQPHARALALYPHNVRFPGALALEAGWDDGCLTKPFIAAQIETMLATPPSQSGRGDSCLTLYHQDILLQPRAPKTAGVNDPDEALSDYFADLLTLMTDAINDIAADCHEEAVIDLRYLPNCDELPRFLEETLKNCEQMCLQPRVITDANTGAAVADMMSRAGVVTIDSLAKI